LSRKEGSTIGLGVEDNVIKRKVFISNGGIFILPKRTLSYLRDFEAPDVVRDGTDNLAIPLLRQEIEDVSLCFSKSISISRSLLRAKNLLKKALTLETPLEEG
jgi:hypothetical protein